MVVCLSKIAGRMGESIMCSLKIREIAIEVSSIVGIEMEVNDLAVYENKKAGFSSLRRIIKWKLDHFAL